jgi:hypothetical protein
MERSSAGWPWRKWFLAGAMAGTATTIAGNYGCGGGEIVSKQEAGADGSGFQGGDGCGAQGGDTCMMHVECLAIDACPAQGKDSCGVVAECPAIDSCAAACAAVDSCAPPPLDACALLDAPTVDAGDAAPKDAEGTS